MPVYTYLLGVGLAVAGLDAFGIGANDNANNFANAIAAKVITPFQAVCIALVFEFAGAVLVGNNVAEAIRGRIISTSLFRSNPALLQLAMVCALIGSSAWIMLATRYGVPVSTTHSIVGAVLGVGVAAFGPGAINWDYGGGRGFAGIVASWFISIAVAGVMAALLYLVMKYGILRYKNSFQRSLLFGPVVFGIAYAIMALALVWKGTPKLGLDKISDNEVLTIVLSTWACTMVATYFWVSLPLYRYHWLGQDLRWYDYLLGGFAPTRPVRADFDASHQEALVGKGIFNGELDDGFYSAQREIEQYNARLAAEKEAAAKDAASSEASGGTPSGTPKADDGEAAAAAAADPEKATTPEQDTINELTAKLAVYEAARNSPRKKYQREWNEEFKRSGLARRVYMCLRWFIMFGIDGREISDYKSGERSHLMYAPKWESRTEKMYNSLNVITSCIQAFAHGSNDVANAIGPLSTIYFIWKNNAIPGNSSPVELWQLAYGGAMICVGLWFYGYNIMRVLGNNLTYQSPSRGFCMDVGSAITILIASKEGFPISTTQAITGATVGVGLANGEWRAVNWWLFAKIFASWVITLPMAGTVAGVIFAFVAYAPSATFNPASV